MMCSVWGAERVRRFARWCRKAPVGSQSNPKALAPFFCVVAELSPGLWKIFSRTFYVASCLFKMLFKFGSQTNMVESNKVIKYLPDCFEGACHRQSSPKNNCPSE
jgi:hypothetical protein